MRRNEQSLQMAIADYLRIAAKHTLWWHTQNNVAFRGGKRLGGIYKAMGVLPGVADILIHWRGKTGIHQMGALELKAGKGKQTESQIVFSQHWRELGGHYAVIRSVDECQAKLREWGVV